MIKKLSLALLSLFGVLAASLVFRAQTMPSLQPQGVAPVSIAVDEAATLQRFAGAIRIPTTSHEESEDTDTAQFLALHAYFEETYPLVHEHLARGIGGGLSLLYTWQGSQRDLVPGGTDAKYYSGRSRHVFRFLPTPMEADALQRIHGTNERMSKEGFVTSIKFFQQLIRNSDGL